MIIKFAISIIFVVSLFAVITSTLLSGINVYALSGSNDKCATLWDRTTNSYIVATQCDSDKSFVDQQKDLCKQTDNKCSSSQTGKEHFQIIQIK